MTTPLTYTVTARRVNAHGSEASCKAASITLDTDLAGREDAFNPAELLLAALSACMLKGIERIAPMLTFELRSVEVRVHGVRQDVPPRMERIDYEIQVDTDEPDRRLELLHENVRKYGTVFNTVAPGTQLSGVLIRASQGGSRQERQRRTWRWLSRERSAASPPATLARATWDALSTPVLRCLACASWAQWLRSGGIRSRA